MILLDVDVLDGFSDVVGVLEIVEQVDEVRCFGPDDAFGGRRKARAFLVLKRRDKPNLPKG